VSHSQDLMVLAITIDRFIGVDVESVRFVEDMDEIARRYFKDEERA